MIKTDHSLLNPFSKFKTFLRRNFFLIAALVVLLSLSLYSWKYVEQEVHRRSELEFEIQCQRIQKLIENRLELYLDALYGTQALFAASHSIERDEWHVFVDAQKLRERYPGISALRYVEYVKLKDREKFIDEVKKDVSLTPQGYPDFAIHPAAEKPEYYVVKYVEPYAGNETMLGLDLGFEPVRLEALEKARDSAQPQVTGQIMLDSGRTPAFFIFLPIYRNGLPLGTLQERRDALEGYVGEVFKAHVFFSAVFNEEKFPSDIDCEVFDGNSFSKQNLLYDYNPERLEALSGTKPLFHKDVTVKFASHEWRFYFSALPGFGLDPMAQRFPFFVLFGGMMSSFLMFFLGVARTRSAFLAKEMAAGVRAKETLQKSHDELEVLVEERTREIRKSEADHRQLVELSPDAILVQSEGVVTFVNAAFIRLFKGGKDRDFIGKRVIDLIHPDYHELVKKRLDELKGRKNVPLVEERWQTLSGDYVNVEVTAAPLSDEEQFSVQVIIRDVSERKRLERQLLQLQKMETVGTLAGGVAHDLNNQLTPVKGYIDLVLQTVDPKSELYQHLTEANLAADRCREVIQRLLVFSRVSKEEKVILSIGNLLSELRSLLKNFLPSTIETEVRFDKEIWPVQGNATELLTVLMNLAANARDAIAGRGKLIFEATNAQMSGHEELEHESGPYVLISVKDDGSGMSPELMKRIFEPFFTTKEKGKGTGLGLAMVYQIVKDHKGWIDVSSQPGHGTCFQIYLPAQPGKTANEKKLEILSDDMMGHGETVLFADDEETIRTLAGYFLARLGYKTIMAEDGQKLIELYEPNKKEIDIVFLDATMPKLTARHALQELFAINPKLKVILTSGFTSEGTTKEFLELGVRSYLQKPYTITAMAKALQQALT